LPAPISSGPRIPSGPRLSEPHVRFRSSFLTALSEYQAEGLHLDLDAGRLAEAEVFALYVDTLVAEAVAGPARFDGWVPQTVLWWVQGDVYLGRLAIRHRLTDALRHHGGHIGFEVRPGARRRGHATAMLDAALPLAAALGIGPALIDCAADNIASRRVIERNGGRLGWVDADGLHFWVPTER